MKGVDAAGNMQIVPDSYSWITDTQRPSTSIVEAPSSLSKVRVSMHTIHGGMEAGLFACVCVSVGVGFGGPYLPDPDSYLPPLLLTGPHHQVQVRLFRGGGHVHFSVSVGPFGSSLPRVRTLA